MCGAEVEGRSFYVAAIVGAPALWAPAREAMRTLQLQHAWTRARHAIESAFSRKVRFALDHDSAGAAEALVVLCPLASKVCDDESAFEAAALDPKSAAEAFKLGVNFLAGEWRRDQSVKNILRCRFVRVWSKRPIPCILDGEMWMLPSDATFTFVPNSFRALVPAIISDEIRTGSNLNAGHKSESGGVS